MIEKNTDMKSIVKNILKKAAALFTVTLCLAACEDAGDKIYLHGHETSDLTVTESTVLLTQEMERQIVLSLTWTKSNLYVSNPSMFAPDAEATYVQASKAEDFTGLVAEDKVTGLSKAYTGAELNAIAKNAGLEPEVTTPLYFRIRSSVGANTESKYSNVVKVDVSAYEIDMTIGYIWNKEKSEVEHTLLSPEANGIYAGFIGATSWYNFWLQEGDGVFWGNNPVDNTEFNLGSSKDNEEPWNAWFLAPGGCYYVVFNTQIREWSALYIPSLAISGELEAEMTFNRAQQQWVAYFDFAVAGTKTIRLSGTGKQYNVSTSTADEAAVETTVAFAGNADALTFGNTAADITIDIPGEGEYALIVDLTNPAIWTIRFEAGEEPDPDPVYPVLYLLGIDDGIVSGGWTFDNSITLYNEDNRNYAGIINVDSKWGYQMAVEKDNWQDYYAWKEGDAVNGELEFKSPENIPAPAPSLYLIKASLTEMTYNHTALGNEIWVMGMDGNYEFDTPLSSTGTPGVYSGEITILEDSEWGIEIQLDDSWGNKLGGNDGTLYYGGSNINDELVHTPGTYTVTVDLIGMTYSITQK